MVIASPRAVFGLPEASRGLYAAAGGLARIVRICGLQVGSEIAMAGRKLSAEEALRFNVINKVSRTHQSVVEETVEMAKAISSLSPDAIIENVGDPATAAARLISAIASKVSAGGANEGGPASPSP